jgi:hypothetical protein
LYLKCPHLSITTSSKIITSRKSVNPYELTLVGSIPFGYAQGHPLPLNLRVVSGGKYEKLGGKLGFFEN